MSAIWKSLTVVAITALLAGAACESGGDSSSSEGEEATDNATAPAASANPDQAVIAELNAVIDHCLNPFNSHLSASLHDYLYVTKGAATFPDKPVRGPAVNKFFGKPAKCREAADKIKASAPSQPKLESAAAGVATAIAALAPKIADAHAYYSQKDYKDDNFAKARKLHGPLMAALHQFNVARNQLSREVAAIQIAMQKRRLAELEKDPSQKLEYLVLDNILTAKQLFAEAGTFKLNGDKIAPHPNDKLPALAAKLRANAKALRAHLKANNVDAIRANRFRHYLSSLDELALAAKELSRRSRSGKPFSAGELASLRSGRTQGSPRHVLAKYNSMVQSHNRL